MELWIPITIAAAFLQNLRSVAQKQLKGVIGTTGATFVRFGFGMPFAFLFVAILHFGFSQRVPETNLPFHIWTVVGGLAQIAAQALLIQLFAFRNFAVGTAYSRTEPAQAAVFGLLFLGERASVGAIIAICISMVGVMLISVAHVALSARSLITSVFTRTAMLGLASGTLFGVSAVSYRAASLALEGPGFAMQAAMTLAVTTLFQTVLMLGWMLWRTPGEIVKIGKAWKPALFTGFVGATASFGWFTAMTLQQAAIVKSLAQVEMLFTFAASVFYFKEKINRLEIAGCAMIVSGILVLLALR